MNTGTVTEKRKQIRAAYIPSPRRAISVLISVFFIAMLIRNPDISIKYVTRGLTLCTSAVIPTLFPFMVLSELLVRTGGGEILGRVFERPMRALFGLSGAGSCAFLLGTVCGFPVGSRTAVTLYDRGLMTREETERLISFCNYPSSAFMISAVGAALWSNRRLGTAMYICVLLAGMLCGIAVSISARRSAKENKKREPPLAACPETKKPERNAVSDSITAAAISTLNVCAYVAFFSCVVGCISHLFARLSPGRITEAAVYSLFELTSGAAAASAVTPKIAGILLCTAAAGWSGLSVHLQVFSVCSSSGLPAPRLRKYIISKAVQAPLAAALMYIALLVFPTLAESADPAAAYAYASAASGYRIFAASMLALFAVSLTAYAIKRIPVKRNARKHRQAAKQ